MKNNTNPIAIVGSGPGGLAAAVALAEQGHQVVVIERGRAFDPAQSKANQFNYESVPVPWPTIKQEWTGSIDPVAAIGIGGSTLYFQGISYMPSDSVLVKWGLRLNDLKKIENTVTNFLNLAGKTQPFHPVNPVSTKLLEGAKDLHWNASPATLAILSRPHEGRPACNQCGLCTFGCMPGDKSSANNTWLPRLMKTGFAQIIKGTEVKKIMLSDQRTAKSLLLDDGDRQYELPVKAVVLAAGVLETPYLLRNSKQQFAENGLGNNYVGRYLSGSLLYSMLVNFAGGTKGYAGVPIDIVVNQFLDEGIQLCQGRNLGGITGPTSLAKFYAKHYGPVGMREWVRNHYPSIAVIAGFAEFEGSKNDGLTHFPQKQFLLTPNEEGATKIKRIAKLLQIWNSASGGKALFVPTQEKTLPTGSMLRGTCKLGGSETEGAVKPDGGLYGYHNISIADASILGKGLIAHPSLPLQVLGFYFGQQLGNRLAA
jgi:choline dehydrogenase-like flavoprotein